MNWFKNMFGKKEQIIKEQIIIENEVLKEDKSIQEEGIPLDSLSKMSSKTLLEKTGIHRITPQEARLRVEEVQPTTAKIINKAYHQIYVASNEKRTEVTLWARDGFTQGVADVLASDGYSVRAVNARNHTSEWWEVTW